MSVSSAPSERSKLARWLDKSLHLIVEYCGHMNMMCSRDSSEFMLQQAHVDLGSIITLLSLPLITKGYNFEERRSCAIVFICL